MEEVMKPQTDFFERLLIRQEVLKKELQRDITLSEIIALTIADQQKDQPLFTNTELLD